MIQLSQTQSPTGSGTQLPNGSEANSPDGGGPDVTSPAPRRPLPDFGPTDRLRGWLVTVFLTVIAGITRFTYLQSPTDGGTPVFDEKHYAPQAWQVVTGGGIEDNPAYGLVVHPPVGKQMIALGEAVFGYTPLGWRFTAAASGTLMVLLTIRITRRLTRSTLIGALAGILLICDGMTYVSSRLGMLDIFQALFVLAAFGCLIVDRDVVRERLAAAAERQGPEAAAKRNQAGPRSAADITADAGGRIGLSPYGPRLGFRWWRFGAGLMLGLTLGTKWSGLYYIAFFGLMSVIFDLVARRAYGVEKPILGTLWRDAIPALGSLVLIPIGTYLASWSMWFASETGYDRYSVGNSYAGKNPPGTGGPFSWVPDALRSLWHYQGETLAFHESLTNSNGNHHPWESKPWSWPMGLRPMLYYYADSSAGCGQSSCVKAVMLIGTPAIWWLALPMLAWALWRAFTRPDWRYAAVLVGYGAGFLPWFATLDRQMYYFYAVPMAPFLMMGMALVLGDILGSGPVLRTEQGLRFLRPGFERQRLNLLLVCLYIGLAVANFVYLWPILNGDPITPQGWHDHLWLPSWR